MFKVDVSEVLNFVNDKSYSDIVKESKKYGLCVKYSNDEQLKNLFLLANKNDNDIENENENENLIKNELLNSQANGIIFEKQTNKVVAMCQNRLIECNNNDDLQNSEIKRIEYCEDGTMIRLYNYNDTWYTSTTRCIDASKSYWTSTKNFSDLFWDVFDKNLLNTLDKKYTYVFVLLHKENRIVVRHKINMLVYISRINNETYIEDFTQQFNNIYGIRRPKKIDNYNFNYNNITDTVENFYNPFKRGIIIKTFNISTNKFVNYKIDYKNYINIKTIRGNVPEIRMRYLELLNDSEKLHILEQNYNEYKFMFKLIKNEVAKLTKIIHKLYIDSHIKHITTVDDNNIYYKTLKQLHAQYKTTNSPILFNDVQKKIYTMDKKIIKRLLMWQELNQKTFNQNTMTESTMTITENTITESTMTITENTMAEVTMTENTMAEVTMTEVTMTENTITEN
jgi:hypothetical protein